MSDITLLILTAVWLGFFHTIIGVDHYLPFILLSKTNNWDIRKTIRVVLLCGLGHILSAVALGLIGVLVSSAVGEVEFIDSFRGSLAAWFLMAFGIVYAVWGIRSIVKNRPHKHIGIEGETVYHSHQYTERLTENGYNHNNSTDKKKIKPMTIWFLFIVFVLGPCEFLLPLLMYPEASYTPFWITIVALCFSLSTIATMCAATFLGIKGISLIKIKPLEKYAHSIAGFSIFLCGFAIQYLGI